MVSLEVEGYNPDDFCMTDLVLSGPGGVQLEASIEGCDAIVYSGCTDVDNDGVCDDVDDCVGEYDECGVCNGQGGTYQCDDGSYVCDASDCPDDGECDAQVCLTLDGSDMNYTSTEDIAGFQFDHDDCATGASGGDAAANGFMISASSSTVLGFSLTGAVIPAGSGTLLENVDCTQGQLDSFVFSGQGGTALTVDWGEGGEPPCDDIDNDDICDDVDDCVGEYDECGVCKVQVELINVMMDRMYVMRVIVQMMVSVMHRYV